jgi:hypothetical protein
MIGGGRGPPEAGNSYSMWTLRSSGADVAGPYSPDPQAYRLSGQDRGATANFGQALAAWSRNYDTYPAGALISQYMVMPHTDDCGAQKSLAGGGHVWLLPLRQPRVDVNGHLRLGHWTGNEALKGSAISLPSTLSARPSGSGGIGTAWFQGSETWDHTKGVVVTGVLYTQTAKAAEIGFVVQTTAQPSPPSPGPDNAGPDKGWDRPGNDYNCFAVNGSFTPADCATACEADSHCQAWTTIDVDEANYRMLTSAVNNSAQIAPLCTHGKPLTRRYCTLKAPVPNVIKQSPAAYTGLPMRSLRNGTHPAKNTSGAQTVTSMLMEVKPDSDLTRATRVRDFTAGATTAKLRDTTGAFQCGAKTPVKCLPATTTGVSAGAHPFLFYARHGTFELYVAASTSEPLMLVQTMTYGKYPVARGKLGLATINGSGAHLDSVQAWMLSL